MNTSLAADLPDKLRPLVQQAAAEVQSAYNVALDFDEAALAFLDALLSHKLRTLARDERQDLLCSVGCCFGEVARRRLGGRWVLDGTDPLRWRVEIEACFLYFYPVGMAGECLVGCESEHYDGTFGTLDSVRGALDERLSLAPPLSEAEYNSLSGRLEVLTLVVDWLVARQLVSDEGPRTFGAEDYRSHLLASVHSGPPA